MRDVIVVLRFEGKMNLFAIFPLGATMQDGGKRKRSDVPLLDGNTRIVDILKIENGL